MMLDFYKGKKVFITGHTGFKGSWLCKLLANAGADVTGYSLNPPTSPSLFEIANIESDVKSVIGDIRDFDSLKKAFDEAQPEIVLHLAAQPIVRDSCFRSVRTSSLSGSSFPEANARSVLARTSIL